MPYAIGGDFTVSSFVYGTRNLDDTTAGVYESNSNPAFVPFVNTKFCRNLPTPAPSLPPSSSPSSPPTDFCLNIHVYLVGYDDHIYDIPSWFDIFGGEYRFNTILSRRYAYRNTDNSLLFYWTGSDWRIYDDTNEYHFELTNSGNDNE